MANGSKAFFEIQPDEDHIGPISDEGIIQDLSEYFNNVMKLVKETAENTYSGFQEINDQSKPSEYELSFGVKITADAGIVFAKVGSEGNFQITLRWTKNE